MIFTAPAISLIDQTVAAFESEGITDIGVMQANQNANRLRQIERDLALIEKERLVLIGGDGKMAWTFQILCSIPGIAKITAATLIVEFPELGTLTSKTVASLSGLAPFARDSGKWKGNRFIGGGRKFLREALYMPALVALQFNPDMKAKYQQLPTAPNSSRTHKTIKSSNHRNNAKALHPRKCPREKGQNVGE